MAHAAVREHQLRCLSAPVAPKATRWSWRLLSVLVIGAVGLDHQPSPLASRAFLRSLAMRPQPDRSRVAKMASSTPQQCVGKDMTFMQAFGAADTRRAPACARTAGNRDC